MTKKIFRSICLVALLVFFSSVTLIMGVLYEYFSDLQLSQLRLQTDLAAQGAANEGIRYFSGLDLQRYRITWIAPDGTILYDTASDTAAMENHLEREEIRQALANGRGESDRYSSTMMERSFYAAKRLPDGSIVRLCTTHGTILILLLGMSQPILFVFAITIALSVILAARLSSHIVRPLNQLDLDSPLQAPHYEELAPLLLRLASQQNQLKLKEAELLQKQEELQAVISHLKEGIILLSADGEILSINPAARALLETSDPSVRIKGRSLTEINKIPSLLSVADNALHGNPSEQIAELKNGHYQITASPVIADGHISGAALLLFDVTQKQKAEQMRREFTANVSHELKTPLHVISGYAELLKNGLVQPADLCPFAEKIYTEAQRMAKLVEDIISLSHLDEGAADLRFETADLFAVASSAVASLTQEAAEAEVTLALSGETAILSGIPQLLFGIVYNLCDNAIKYNRKHGDVFIEVKNQPGRVSLMVRDTGIGIPPEHQEPVFERFYRVDKSHSKDLGGTGLGLSIVKHAAKIHKADIHLESTPGAGTEITILFPVLDGVEKKHF